MRQVVSDGHQRKKGRFACVREIMPEYMSACDCVKCGEKRVRHRMSKCEKQGKRETQKDTERERENPAP